MKLFRVLFDTPLRREERYYAATTASEVWEAIKIDRMDEAMTFIALIEHAPSVVVLPPETNGERK